MNRVIKVKITPLQNQLIKNTAENLGYRSKSAFCRDMIIKENYKVEKMVSEIYEKVCDIEN